MKIQVSHEKPQRVAAEMLALPIFADPEPEDAVVSVDRSMGGIIRELYRNGELKRREDELHVIPSTKLRAKRVALIGLGSKAHFSAAGIQRFAGLAVRAASRRGLTSVACVLPESVALDPAEAGELFAEGALMATFDPAPYRSNNESRGAEVKSVILIAPAANARSLKAGIARGLALGEAVNAVREMVNLPSNDMTPSHLAERAKAFGKQHGLKVTVLDRAEMKRMGMGSFLSVSAGSEEPPKMIAIEYRGDKSTKTTLGLVGKGITFDTGGISLKPAQDMDAMKGDMAGGATVIGAMAAIGQLKPKVNVIGIVCATENMPSGKATKPGDIVRAMNGKSIEIINTDAEGRLVLADGLCWARKLGATHLLDIATLTGAAVVAFGHTTTGVMSNDRALVDLFHQATAPYGERYWELPLFPEYAELIKSPIADMKNSGGRPAGTIFGAMFLKEFVEDVPWVHLDIAGTSWAEKDGGHIVKGPTGVALRPMVRLAELMATRAPHGHADEAAQRRFLATSSAEAAHKGGNGKSSGRVRARRSRAPR
ncbi:MAG TPA: leucyl aminopeptidase [Candidatus Tumulicola sp.]|nr:leucyl aminopeptidase [Candidatus Tumulicola sp.]